MRAFWIGLFGLGLCGCTTVGPDYKAPEAETGSGWIESASGIETKKPPPDAWWGTFQDPVLKQLIDLAVAGNPTLREAEGRLREARAQRIVAGGTNEPAVDARAGYSRNHAASHGSNLFQAGFDAAWEIDLFGKGRRTVEAAEADVAAAEQARRDTLVQLEAEVARNYFDYRALGLRLEVLQRNLSVQQASLEVSEARFKGGLTSELDVEQAKTQLASTQAQVPALESLQRQTAHLIAVLLGETPGSVDTLLAGAPKSGLPPAPPAVPVGLPADLLKRRPDIREAEAQLHAATARIGVAKADLFPRVTLTGSLGLASTSLQHFVEANSATWSLGPDVTFPLFNRERLKASVDVERARRDQATAFFKGVVLSALQEVEDALVAYAKERSRRKALAEAVASSRRSVDLARDLYSKGVVDFLNVLSAEGSLYSSEDALVQSDQATVTDLVALYKALGGGWEGYPEAGGR